jgi:hypothetical protein
MRRFGANEATTLHTDAPITPGNLRIPNGDFALFILYTSAGWQLFGDRETA